MTSNEFNAKIDELWSQTKAGNLPREERFVAIERLTDRYITATGKRPDPSQLDRLATLCLYEEVTDDRPDKMTLEEYPIMSDEQYARRTEGKHVRRHGKDGKLLPNKTEIPLNAAFDYGTDGKNYRTPKRRPLSTDEASRADAKLTRNKERRRKYNEFIKPGIVEVSYIGD
ncbi:hypothetical protein [Cytobacillus solani]|uniref:Uncharacterized protein n=1 Tax=Cytobacillus solani TaxID=1637975 RepID=A0A0Q3VFT1_9BACI|nr:hypothetical protein [Cytobacillus solani]KQL18842.1 hypothetical protein AN957_09850 [Cytobacillus solani]